MSEVPSERDDRLALLLTEALDAFRGGETVDVAALQARHPDLAGELPDLLETLLTLDTAVEDWKRIASPETRQLPPGVDTSEPAAAPTLPARVGRYRILGRLGQGGMGTVYRAEDPQLQRVVALKVPRFEGPERLRETAVKRFLREARAAAQVRHPHVCPIHDVGEQDGVPYVVMDYVEGQSLADRLASRPRYDDPAEAVRLVREVAEALEAVHARGLVHRDLKPGNILLDTAGRAVLTDFGLARSDQDAEHLTADGALIGTPAYMAPEQASLASGQVGPSTDVYSLGVVLYQMLTGRLPFEGPLLKVIHSIAHETPPPLRQLREELDPALEGIVLRAMARQSEERYATAREFADALGRWAVGAAPAPQDAPPAGPVATPAPTVIRSDLPDGGSITVSLQPGAAVPKKLNVTVREQRGKRRRRVLAVSVTVSLSLLLAIGGLYQLVQLRSLSSLRQEKSVAQAWHRQADDALMPASADRPEPPGKAAPRVSPGHFPPEHSMDPPTQAVTPPAPAGGAAPAAPAAVGSAPSSVSVQNRMVERYAAPYGAYWMNYDFKQGYPLTAAGGVAPAPLALGDRLTTPADYFRAGAPLNQNYYNAAVFSPAWRNFPPYAFPGLYAGGFNSGAPRVLPTGALAQVLSSPSTTPYAGYGGTSGYSPDDHGYNPYYSYADPYGGGLRGAADAIRAQGTFAKDFQQARLLNLQVERSQVETRQKIYVEWLYERANTPTIVDIQEQEQKLEIGRALVGVPLSEVLNAYALNKLLDDLRKKGDLNLKDPYGPIDPDILKQINVASQGSTGNLGVLKPVKEGSTLSWPLPLQGAAYQDEVRRLNQRAAEAVKLVQNTGSVDPGTLNDMKEDIRRLRSKVAAHIDDLTPPQAIEANRFLNQLSDAATALAQPDAASYFTDKFAAKGKTVPELVQFMANKRLKFAPATGGDEAAYAALYKHLVSYALQAGQAGGH